MKRLILAALALVLLRADMYPDASNAKLPGARINIGAGHPVSIKDHGAKADAVQWWDGTVAAGSTTFTSALATFTPADVGKKIQIDGGAGITAAVANGQPAVPPFATTIAAVTGAHTVTLAAPAPAATPRWHNSQGNFTTGMGTGGSYVPGDVLTGTGGTFTTATSLKVNNTRVRATTIVAGGTGGTDGSCVVEGTTGTGTRFKQTVTISGGAITALGTLENGYYYTNPASLAAEPVGNPVGFPSCVPAGATLSLAMGVGMVSVELPGEYTTAEAPANPMPTGPGSLSGATGATFTLSWNHSGTFVYGTDDSQALADAILAAGALFAAHKPSYVFIPAGSYLIDQVTTPTMRGMKIPETGVPEPATTTGPVGIVGEGSTKTNLIIGANYVGDVFSWSEAWLINGLPFNGTVSNLTKWNSGARAIGFSISGNRTAAAKQSGLVFYDRTMQAYVDDVDVLTLNGHCLSFGKTKYIIHAFVGESKINRLRCWGMGSAGYPAIEVTTTGAGDRSNTNIFRDIDVYASYDTGVAIYRGDTSVWDRLRIEGLQQAIPADLLLLYGNVNHLAFNDLLLISAHPTHAAIRIGGPSPAEAPYNIRVTNGSVGGLAQGDGVVIEAGRNMQFQFSGIGSLKTGFTMGPNVTFGIDLDGYGLEHTWTYNLTYPQALTTPMRRYGSPVPVSASAISYPATVTMMPDSSARGGNLRGGGAVDLQARRSLANQVASGPYAVIGGGEDNLVGGILSVIGGGSKNSVGGAYATVSGGFTNVATGFNTTIPGGGYASDRGAAGGMYLAPFGCQPFQIGGTCQRSWHVMSAFPNTAAAARLTTDHAAPGGANCVPIPAGTAYQTVVRATARNWTSNVVASWDAIQGMLYRAGGATTYLGGAGGAAAQSTGALGTLAVAADATNNCLALTYTPTVGNTDSIHIVATVDVTEVQ